VLELVRRPQWLFGTGAVLVGLALQPLAIGVIYGTTAALIKAMTAQVRSDGLLSIFTHPVLYRSA
jgi:hypothetical protein